MASPPAGPITGSELIRVVQGGVTCWFTRPQMVALLALPSVPGTRPGTPPTAFLGTELIEAIQGGVRVALTGADLATYLAASGAAVAVPPARQPTALTGAERVVGRQGGQRVDFTVAEAVTLSSGGAATAPAAPTLAVTAGNAQNSIAWTDGSNGGSAITARKLYRSTTSGFTPGPGNLIATSPTFPYADTGLTNGTTYYYKGIATNAIGDSAASTEQSGAPSAGTAAPTAPGYLAASPAPYAAPGAQRIVSGYSGPLFRLRRASPVAEMDVSAQAGGDYPDYTAIIDWAAGSALTVPVVYDQTGNGRHFTEATPANQPSFDPTQKVGNVAPILIDGFGRANTAPLLYVTKKLSVGGLSLDLTANSAVMAVQSQVSWNGNALVQATDEAGTTAVEEFFLLKSAGLTVRTGTSNDTVTAGLMRASFDTIGFATSATARKIYYKGTIRNATRTVVSTPIPRLTFGTSTIGGVGYSGMSRLFGTAFYSQTLSDAEMAASQASLNTAFSAPTTYDFTLALSGDSIMEGTGGTLLRSMPYWLSTVLTTKPEIFNMAIHGTTIASQFGDKAQLATCYTAGRRNLVFLQAGTNDVANGALAADMYANTKNFVIYLKGLGYKVIVCTILPRPGLTSPKQTELANYNSAVVGNDAGADYVLDLAQHPVMAAGGAASDTTLYVDGVHPTALGYRWLAGAPTGTYANQYTYYYAIQQVLTATALTLAQRGLPSVFQSGALPVSVTETSPQSGVFGSTYSQATFDTAAGTMYYVSAAGSDANDGLSSGAPKATLQAAVDAAATGNRITITTAGRYAPAVVLNKNLSIYGSVAGIYIGSFLTNADVSSWGTPASGRQAVTLTTGTVSGFVDLTKNRRTDRQSNAIPQVSQVATTAAAIATLQTGKTTTAIELALYGTTIGTADPQAGVFRSTPSQIGASDARDLTNKFDTELLAWRSTAVSPLAVTGTSQVFIKGVTFVGAQTTIAVGARAVYDTCRFLGSIDQCASITGISVFYNCSLRGCATVGADILDYDSTGYGTEVGCFLDQCSTTGADNCSTAHGGTAMRINGTYLDASRCWSDVQGSIVAGFGCTLAAGPDNTRYSLNLGDAEGHFAGITFITTGAYDIRIAVSTPTTWSTRGFFYDTSYVGKNIDLTNGTYRSPTDRTTAKATADASLASVDLTNLSTLFQTADTSTPVTAVGQPVTRINLVEDGTDYILLTAGAYTYTDVAGKKFLRSSGTANTNNFAFRINSLLFEENCNITLGIVSADTTGILMRNPSSPNFYGSYSSGNLTGTGLGTPGQRVNAPTYTVDGAGSYTTATALKAAAFNSLPHVVTIKGADLGWLQWTKTPNFMQIFDGDFYGLDISRVTNDTNLRTHEQAMAAKNGATVP